MTRLVAGLAALMFSAVGLATTWAPSEKVDPLTGEKVSSQDIMSYGGYIYEWPSKYDLVFWPLTDENWICIDPKNGYGAFNNDFEELADAEKAPLADWLSKNYKLEVNGFASHKEKLAWLERVYGQRKMDDDFWCRFYRLMVYIHQKDAKTSTVYMKKAMALLEKKLATKPEGIERLEVLYLLGEYHRRLGDSKKSEAFFDQVEGVTFKDEDGEEHTDHPYFKKLVEDRRKLKEDSSKKSVEPTP